MTPELGWAVAQAYALFQKNPLTLRPRTALWDEDPAAKEAERRVRRTALPEQRREDLEVCLMGACDAAGVRHFLPRLFELFADDVATPWPSYLAFKLAWSGAPGWAPDERAVVTRFFAARFLGQLRSGDVRALAETLGDCALALGELGALLLVWDWEATRTATVMLARFVQEEAAALERRLRSDEWAPPQPLVAAADALAAWLRSPAVLRRLEEAYRTAPEAPGSSLIASAVVDLMRP
jgi:hypothetical protein